MNINYFSWQDIADRTVEILGQHPPEQWALAIVVGAAIQIIAWLFLRFLGKALSLVARALALVLANSVAFFLIGTEVRPAGALDQVARWLDLLLALVR